MTERHKADEPRWLKAGIEVSLNVEALYFGETEKGFSFGVSYSIPRDEWWDWIGGSVHGDRWVEHPDPEDLWARFCAARLQGKITRLLGGEDDD